MWRGAAGLKPGLRGAVSDFPIKMAYIANLTNPETLMATRNVVLTDQQEALVTRLVTSGRYQNASEALRAGLRLLEAEEAGTADLRAKLAEGLRQAEAGEMAEGSEAEAVRRDFAKARDRA